MQVADVSKQYRGYGARPFYITTLHTCRSCGVEFRFSAEEQKLWFEELGFFIDAYPGCCLPCRKEARSSKAKMRRYNQYHADDDGSLTTEQSRELADLIMELFGPALSEKLKTRYNRMLNRIADTENREAI